MRNSRLKKNESHENVDQNRPLLFSADCEWALNEHVLKKQKCWKLLSFSDLLFKGFSKLV